MERAIVRLVLGTNILEEREMDRTPLVGETVVVGNYQDKNEKYYQVKDVIWRPDGHASLMISGRYDE